MAAGVLADTRRQSPGWKPGDRRAGRPRSMRDRTALAGKLRPMTSWNDISLETVETIADFKVELRELEDAGKLLHFVSDSRGELAWFPAWENADRDLRHFTASDVPIGSIAEPYDDCDDGWRIVIFEHGGYVYVFEDDRPKGTRFPRRFRVPRDRYFLAWATVMHQSNPLISLDDLMNSGDA